MFGKTYNNCVKKEEVENVDEACWKTHEQRGMKKKGVVRWFPTVSLRVVWVKDMGWVRLTRR